MRYRVPSYRRWRKWLAIVEGRYLASKAQLVFHRREIERRKQPVVSSGADNPIIRIVVGFIVPEMLHAVGAERGPTPRVRSNRRTERVSSGFHSHVRTRGRRVI